MAVNYKELYFHLAGKVSDAIDAIELMGEAPDEKLKNLRGQLIQAIQEAEEEYLKQGE